MLNPHRQMWIFPHPVRRHKLRVPIKLPTSSPNTKSDPSDVDTEDVLPYENGLKVTVEVPNYTWELVPNKFPPTHGIELQPSDVDCDVEWGTPTQGTRFL